MLNDSANFEVTVIVGWRLVVYLLQRLYVYGLWVASYTVHPILSVSYMTVAMAVSCQYTHVSKLGDMFSMNSCVNKHGDILSVSHVSKHGDVTHTSLSMRYTVSITYVSKHGDMLHICQ